MLRSGLCAGHSSYKEKGKAQTPSTLPKKCFIQRQYNQPECLCSKVQCQTCMLEDAMWSMLMHFSSEKRGCAPKNHQFSSIREVVGAFEPCTTWYLLAYMFNTALLGVCILFGNAYTFFGKCTRCFCLPSLASL